jgi:hypothetical protein
MIPLTFEQLHILQHSLGCDQYGQSKHRGRDEHDGCFGYYRNRFVTDPEDKDGKQCADLVVRGLMKDYGPQRLCGGMHCFCVTEYGIQAMQKQSPAPPKLTRSQQRYRAFRESECDMPFLDFARWWDAQRKTHFT